jgi:hypothetical protein
MVPPWFKDMDYIEWDGMLKDLYNIDGIAPEQAILVDDAEIFILENQKSQWIEIKQDDPYLFLRLAEKTEKVYMRLETLS